MNMSPEKRLGFGCVKLSACQSERQAMRSLITAFEGGIRWFDTAPLYGRGYSEWILGKFLRKLSKRDKMEIQIVTKFGLGPSETPRVPPFVALPLNHWRKRLKKQKREDAAAITRPPFHPKPFRSISAKYIDRNLRASLKRLGVEQIAGYIGHECLPSFIEEEGMALLKKNQAAGNIALLGIGISAQDLYHAKDEDFTCFDLIQYNADDTELSHGLQSTFPHLHHVHHSIVKNAMDLNVKPNDAIRSHASMHTHCRILFSSMQPKNIKNNIGAFH